MRKLNRIYLWKKAPFIRLLPPLVLGIIAGYFFDVAIPATIISAGLIFLFIFAFEFLNHSTRFKWRIISGLLYHLLIFISGVFLWKANDIKRDQNWFGNHLTNATDLKIVLKSKPQPRDKTFKVSAEIQNIFTTDTVINTKGKALFYLSKDTHTAALSSGDVLFVKNKLQEIQNRGNPGEFDYKSYLRYQNIYYQAFLKKEDWQATEEKQQSIINSIVGISLNYSHRSIDTFLTGYPEKALARALLTGDRSALDRDLVQAYANTGVVHIMAISGLHLGLIYILLLRLCNTVPLINRDNRIKFAVILAGIWFFAMMTGASPSVVRAAVMFSFLAVSILKKRKIATYNFWAVAAFIILCFNPLLLFNVGFQLSFLAVLGILVVQKPVYHWIHFDNKIVDYAWQLISVTISAQLFTLPLCLYYFQQFPVLFLLVNLIAIPLASAGLWLGVLLLLTAWLPFVPDVIGLLTDAVLKLMNRYIQYMNSFEFSIWQSGRLTITETFLLSLLVIFFLAWLMNKHKTYLKLALTVSIMMATSTAVLRLKLNSQKKIIIYNIPSASAIDFISANKYAGSLYSSGNPAPGASDLITSRSREFFSATRSVNNPVHAVIGNNDLYVSKKSLLHIKSNSLYPPLEKKIRLDVIAISGSPDIRIKDLQKTFDAEIYVFTPANKRYLIERWKKECEELHLHSHDITNEGALVLNY